MSEGILIGMDVGGTQVRAAAVTRGGHLLARSQAATADCASYDALVDVLKSLVREVLDAAGHSAARMAGIGIGCTGPVDPLRGNIYVSEFGANRITLLRPVKPGPEAQADKTRLLFVDPRGGAVQAIQHAAVGDQGDRLTGSDFCF